MRKRHSVTRRKNSATSPSFKCWIRWSRRWHRCICLLLMAANCR
jgi:hypothetical protein